MSDLGYDAYRFSIEWSRIEPEKGKFDEKEIQHYKNFVDYMRGRNIEPIPMLWHYTNPLWFMKKGGWLKEKNVEYFLDFVKKIIEEFDFNYWLTIDEPMVYAFQTCTNDNFPPASLSEDGWSERRKNLDRILEISSNLLKAHSRSYDILNRNSSGKIGFSKAVNALEPASDSPLNIWATELLDYFENGIWLQSLDEKKLLNPLSEDGIGDCIDFFGLNYFYGELGYFDIESNEPPYFWFQRRQNENTEENDMNWWIYPEGLFKAMKRIHEKLEKPIMITSNGIGTAEDLIRRKYLIRHLKKVSKALDKNIKVIGYLYWSFLDNFEWDQGFDPRFGLVEVDYDFFERKPRKSARMYGEIARKNGISREKMEKYLD